MNQDHCLVEQFEMIFRAHFSSVKFFINMFLKSEADAEDLAQDVFTKLWTNFETWQNNDGKEDDNAGRTCKNSKQYEYCERYMAYGIVCRYGKRYETWTVCEY